MPRILVIDDDPGTLAGYGGILRGAGFDVLTAATGREGLALLQTPPPDLVLLDLNLPDISGLEVLDAGLKLGATMPFVIVTGHGSTASAVRALKMGAFDYVEKPLFEEELLRVAKEGVARIPIVTRELHSDPNGPSLLPPIGPAARRWAIITSDVVRSKDDIPTTEVWAHAIGKAQSTIKTWCYAVHVSAGDTLDFARCYRIVRIHAGREWDLFSLLNVVDARTIDRIMDRVGLPLTFRERAPDVQTFLGTQRLVPSPALLAALDGILRDSDSDAIPRDSGCQNRH